MYMNMLLAKLRRLKVIQQYQHNYDISLHSPGIQVLIDSSTAVAASTGIIGSLVTSILFFNDELNTVSFGISTVGKLVSSLLSQLLSGHSWSHRWEVAILVSSVSSHTEIIEK